jgi:NAD(P)-dependent dehydrogenase (short-subunit alcohol dehydrogenase family)
VRKGDGYTSHYAAAATCRAAKDGIAVTSVAPGLTRTPSTAYQPDETFTAAPAHPGAPRALVPEDVAVTVGFLAGDGAEALTGQVLTVDGGSLLR